MLLGSAYNITGVLGIVWRNDFQRAKTLMIFGGIGLGISLISMVALQGMGASSFLYIAIGGCYIFGAYKNKM